MDLNLDTELFFSVVIPTRNRPEMFRVALESVLAQNFENFEIIIIDDGSTADSQSVYKEFMIQYSTKVTLHSLVYRPNGHGPSYTRNYGAQLANGKYVCFLDDDDSWSDSDHLLNAYKSISSKDKTVDVYYSNQKAFFENGKELIEFIWIEELSSKINDFVQDECGAVFVDTGFLMQSSGFAHMNCTIVNRAFFCKMNGMDENIRYESDREFYLRTIDEADFILYNPAVIARHNIPDSQKKNNVSTKSSPYEKLIFQLRTYNKGMLFAKKKEIRHFCKTNKMYTLKKLTECLQRDKNYGLSRHFAFQALSTNFSFKWLIFTAYLTVMSFIVREVNQDN